MSVTVPSGDPVIVDLRRRLRALLPWMCDAPVVSPSLPLLEHGNFAALTPSSAVVYIGNGSSDPQGRPSPLCNPFSVGRTAKASLPLFRAYLGWRADIEIILSSIMGRSLLCDCTHGPLCHGLILIGACSLFFSVSPPPPVVQPTAAPVLSVATAVTKPPSASRSNAAGARRVFLSSDGPPLAPAVDAGAHAARSSRVGRRPAEDLAKVNESLRSRRARVHRAPGWSPLWRQLVDTIRAFPVPCFWEIFSGSAGLSK